jgi:predicted regulator of Ras-like GTPase activity (Roadblock/LC7/MglB family)
MTVQRLNMNWLLKDLATSVPQTRHVVVLSSDGLSIAELSAAKEPASDTDTADRIAAACAGLQSLAAAVAFEFPHGEGRMRLVVIELDGGFFYLMAAGQSAYLAVLADEGVDSGLMGQRMRDLVARIGEHLSTAPRSDEAV